MVAKRIVVATFNLENNRKWMKSMPFVPNVNTHFWLARSFSVLFSSVESAVFKQQSGSLFKCLLSASPHSFATGN